MYQVLSNHTDCHPETCSCWNYKLVDSGGNAIDRSDDYAALKADADRLNEQLENNK